MLYKKSFIKLLLLCLKAGRGNWSTEVVQEEQWITTLASSRVTVTI